VFIGQIDVLSSDTINNLSLIYDMSTFAVAYRRVTCSHLLIVSPKITELPFVLNHFTFLQDV